MFAARHEHNHVLFHLVLISGISLCSGAFISCCSIFSFQLATLLITMFNKVYCSTSSFADAVLLKGFVDYELEGVSSTAYWNRFVFLNCCQIAATILDLLSSFFNFARHDITLLFLSVLVLMFAGIRHPSGSMEGGLEVLWPYLQCVCANGTQKLHPINLT